MSEAAKPPLRRNRGPVVSPPADRTRLFYKAGIPMYVGLHSRLGFHLGSTSGRAIWSHDPNSTHLIAILDRDSARTASSWLSPQDAQADLLRQLTLADWNHVTIIELTSDVATAHTPIAANALSGPQHYCSIELCCRMTSHGFTPEPHHRLETTTTSR